MSHVASRRVRGLLHVTVNELAGRFAKTARHAMLRRAARAGLVGLLASALLASSAHLSPAQGQPPDARQAQDARQEVVSAADFRVRVTAALALGRSRVEGARQALERALGDPHPTVRTAAAAALAALGDAQATGALERRISNEPSEGVRSQIRTTLASLRGVSAPGSGGAGAGSKSTRYALQIGSMKNLSGVRGPELGNVLRVSTQKRALELPGAVVVDDVGSARRGVPVFVLDGSLTKLAQQSHANGAVAFTARVEFTLRKVPENTLKGALSGGATSVGTAKSVAIRQSMIALQDQAVEGAVESAMRGANEGLLQAAR